MRLFVTDDRILIALDSGNDNSHAGVGCTAQLVLEHVIHGMEPGFQHQLHLSVADTELPLQAQMTRNFGGRCGI
jgi:hypothetical protein